MIKLVLLDVDGTITDINRSLSLSAVESMRRAQQSGIIVSLVSGNVIPVMYALKTYIGLRAPVFGENGGIMLTDDTIKAFFDISKPLNFFNHISKEGLASGILTNKWRETSMGYSPASGMEERIVEISREYDVEVVNSGYSWHILNKGQDKGFALSVLIDMFKLKSSEAAVIGDSFNDVPMFKNDVMKAVPANAEPTLRRIADLVSIKSHGEGTSDLLQRIMEMNQ
ncbi:MAG: phosphoglycolate phosphatase [Thermoplasmataceae archaeon]